MKSQGMWWRRVSGRRRKTKRRKIDIGRLTTPQREDERIKHMAIGRSEILNKRRKKGRRRRLCRSGTIIVIRKSWWRLNHWLNHETRRINDFRSYKQARIKERENKWNTKRSVAMMHKKRQTQTIELWMIWKSRACAWKRGQKNEKQANQQIHSRIVENCKQNSCRGSFQVQRSDCSVIARLGQPLSSLQLFLFYSFKSESYRCK